MQWNHVQFLPRTATFLKTVGKIKRDFACFKPKVKSGLSLEIEPVMVTQCNLPQKAMNTAKKTVAPLSNINVTCQKNRTCTQASQVSVHAVSVL